ncbi:MAG TPA: hypothetical protein VKE49_01225 [Myxococcaceae bacterium]|nr:hypothetical protein [Myxococcaceae bacterium]
MASERFRLDLDGVEMKDGNGRVVCILRWRTVQGLVLRLPESTDVMVPWRLVSEAALDLASGGVRLRFKPDARRELTWLQSWTELNGEWTDRQELTSPPAA